MLQHDMRPPDVWPNKAEDFVVFHHFSLTSTKEVRQLFNGHYLLWKIVSAADNWANKFSNWYLES